VPGYNNYNGGYFCQFFSTNKNTCCNVFISTNNAVIPGTFRLSIANFSVSFSNVQQPVTFPEDLCTNVVYNVVIAYDRTIGGVTEGATLMIDPSQADYDNLLAGAPQNSGFVYGTDKVVVPGQNNIYANAISFQPYITAGISNVVVGTTFEDVYNPDTQTAPPVFGLQPVSGTNYSGNSATFSAIAGGSDVTYQWYSTGTGSKLVDDGVNIIGSTSNILVLNNLTGTDSYYVIATDAKLQSTTSATATETVDTTLTGVFFDPSVTAVKLTNNLFTTATFTDTASGTGPISYQWYFKSTNVGSSFVPVSGQTSPTINVYLADYSSVGQYYVAASNTTNGTTTTVNGPINTLVGIAPLVATIDQLHTFMSNNLSAIFANPGGTVNINNNNVTVSGYVSSYRGYGTTYTTFYIQNTNGYGVQVFLNSLGNTNAPPIGSYVTVSAPLSVYHSNLEYQPTTRDAWSTNPAPPIVLNPFLGNPYYGDFVTNPIGANSVRFDDSLITFTNVYIYGSSTGGNLGTGGTHSGVGGVFVTNTYTTLYATVGAPYDSKTNSMMMEIFVPNYDPHNYASTVFYGTNDFDGQVIPTHCAQVTGMFLIYGGTPSYVEVIPMRYADFVVSNPSAFNVSVGVTNKNATVSWSPVVGQTYSVKSATNLNSSWKNEAYGLNYYPTNGSFSQATSSNTPAKFFRVTTP